MTTPDLDELRGLGEADELRGVINALETKLKRSKAKTADLIEAVYQAAHDAAVTVGKPPAVKAPKADRRNRPECAVLHLSDWHIGKETSSFNSQVASERVEMLADKVRILAEIERADHPVRSIHALLGGDMAENLGIFPGQAYEVDSTMFTQVFTATAAIEKLLRSLLSSFQTVDVWEQAGNHGRIGRRGDNPRADNIDRLIYRIVQDRFQDEKRLTWHNADSWFSIVEVGNYRALLIHGDQIKSFGGNTPAFGITRKVNAWATGVLPPFTDCMMGHFHTPLVLPIANGRGRTFVNPSIESDSEYAREFVASTGTPGQRLHFVEPERGRITSERIVWLDS